MESQVLNRVKEKCSKAFMSAIAAKLGFAVMEANAEFDSIGIDFTISNQILGEKRLAVSDSGILQCQLKAVSVSSSSMIEEDENFIRYNITSTISPAQPALYLIVVVLPPEEELDSWVETNQEETILRQRAYYHRVSDPIPHGFLAIPKINKLDAESLPKLFLSREELI